MTIIDDYNQYLGQLEQLASSPQPWSSLQSRVVHRGEAALALLWKQGLYEAASGEQDILLVSSGGSLDIFELSGKLKCTPLPTPLSTLHSQLSTLFAESRTSGWWNLCFGRNEAGQPLHFDNQYGSLFASDTSDITLDQLLDQCRDALSAFPAGNILLLADDDRLLPLCYVMQQSTHTSCLTMPSPFDQCDDKLLADFRAWWGKKSGMQNAERPQLVYVPADSNLDETMLAPGVPLSNLLTDSADGTTRVTMGGVECLCFVHLATTDLFGNTVDCLIV